MVPLPVYRDTWRGSQSQDDRTLGHDAPVTLIGGIIEQARRDGVVSTR
jgi:hypothetical protein